MTEPTLSEMAEACDQEGLAALTNGAALGSSLTVEHGKLLRAAARTLRRVDYAIRKNDGLEIGDKWTSYEAFQHVREGMRAMQAQEQAAERIQQADDWLRERRRGTQPPAADPPSPPEDALLAELDRWISVLGTAKAKEFRHLLNDNDFWHIQKALSDARDRIAADAEDLADYARIVQHDTERIDAAEARAQRAEDALRDIASANYAGPGYRVAGDRGEEADDFAERLQELASAALAQPEPERKDG